jgi:hypothetical protein
MRPASLLNLLLLFTLGVCAAAGWGWGWQQHQQLREGDFTRRRLAFIEQENRRLGAVLAEKQRAESSAAERRSRTEIERAIATLRRLDFLKPVTYREIPRSELPAILRQKLAQQVPDQEFGDMGVALAALGLLPKGTDLKKTYLDLLGEQIGAFYDQHTHELFTFSGQPLSNSQNRVILAHELTHALQDQHFNLSRLPLEAKGNDDRSLAASALVEGDATLAMNRFLIANVTPGAIKDVLAGALTTDVRQLAAAPRYLRESLLFPYLRGQEFCQTLYAGGGWEALGQAFQQPPSSTAQILHPEKYLAQPREEPIAVEFGDTTVLGQKPIVDNVLGEFGARQYFAAWLHGDDKQPAEAASGWRGDRYLVYGGAQASSYIWKTVCADKAAAEKFAESARSCQRSRYRLAGGSIVEPFFARSGARELKTCITSENEVIVMDAQDALWSAALGERFALGVRFAYEH